VAFIAWIEETWLGEVVRASAYGYPLMITLHSLGLAVMVGLSVILSLRVFGFFSTIPYSSLERLLKIAWIGFIINLISGFSLYVANATGLIVDPYFLIKMGMVILGAILVGTMQSMINTAFATGSQEMANMNLKIVAGAVIFCWTAAMVTGRLIAYL